MEKIIGQIRDILRKEGVTGMDSINHCIAFLVCRLLDEELCTKVSISTKYSFNNMMKDDNGDEIGDQELYDRFYRKGKPCFVGELVNKLKFANIKFKMEGIHNLKSIMKKLQKLDINNLSVKYDLIGTIYEIHLKSGTSNSMRDLGQYYTHRLVIKYMIELCDIKMIDGLIEKTVDPTMGTGGFLTMAIKHLKSKYENIDWTKNKDNIIGFDIDDNVKNMALLNVFLEIGELCTDTLVKQDTLHNDLKFNNGTILQKAKVILANEPMGLKNITHASCCDRIKNMKLRGTKAEPLFLQLFMEALDDGGRCAVIVPDGVLFNESDLHKNTRKHMIENFNLKKVIALNDDKFFLNTGVKTSILFFAKDGTKTKEVDFCEIIINDNEEIEENKVIKVNYDTIKENNYSLFVNKYNVEELEKIEGLEYKKLGDICKILNGYAFKSSDYTSDGKYNVITIKNVDNVVNTNNCRKIKYNTKYNKYEIKYNDIIMSMTGNIKIGIYKLQEKSYLNQRVIKFYDFTKGVLPNYIYYYLDILSISNLQYLTKGSIQGNISSKELENLQIPITSLKIQNKIVEQLDVLSENNDTLEKNIGEFKKIMKYYVESHTMGCEVDKLGNVCETHSGDYIKKKDMIKGKYPVYGGGDISNHINIKNRKDTFVIAKDGVSLNCVRYIYGDFFLNHHGWTLNYKTNNLYSKFVYYWLWSNQLVLYNLAHGSAQKGINRTSFYNVNIPIPSKEKQKEIVEYCDNLSNMIDNMEKQITKNTELMKNILENYLNMGSDNVSEESKTIDEELLEEQEMDNTNEDSEEELSEEIVKIIEVEQKKKKKNKKSKTIDEHNVGLVDDVKTKYKKKHYKKTHGGKIQVNCL